MAADPLPSPPPGFATLAKRISAWTTNSLLTLLVLVAGVGFGRQVLKWWAEDRAAPADSPAAALANDGLGDLAQLHTIQFGDASWSLRRRSVVGDKNQAIKQLRAACRDVLSDSPRLLECGDSSPLSAERSKLPHNAAAQKKSGDESPHSKDKFLAALSHSTPVEQKAGQWRLYELHEAFPLAAGVARSPVAPATEGKEADLARLGYRVVIWGVAVPTGRDQWALCTFQPEPPTQGGGGGLIDVPLPPEGQRTLSLRAARGGGITAFTGPDRPADWRRFYDDWFAHQGWQRAAGWQAAGPGWYARFAAPTGGDSVDIRFGPDGRGGLTGIVLLLPRESR